MIRLQNIVKTYLLGDSLIRALDDVSLEIHRGEFVAITGSSGSGKSTLMNLLGCLDRPTSGVYHLDAIDVSSLESDELARVRNQKIGFVFQNFNLLPRMSALENVMQPLYYASVPESEARDRARDALARVGLQDRMGHHPNQLSGGQRQRVAIARSLINNPAILLADEPTGNLDSQTGSEVLNLFCQLHEEGRTILVVTHDREVAGYCQKRIHFKDGRQSQVPLKRRASDQK